MPLFVPKYKNQTTLKAYTHYFQMTIVKALNKMMLSVINTYKKHIRMRTLDRQTDRQIDRDMILSKLSTKVQTNSLCEHFFCPANIFLDKFEVNMTLYHSST